MSMRHSLVRQLNFARGELIRCLKGVGEEDARRRIMPMNSLSWIVGHLANQENYYWVRLAQGKTLRPGLRELVGYGRAASTPPMEEMWAAWREVTSTADLYLNSLREDDLDSWLRPKEDPHSEPVGVMLLRVIYHYWFHTGEAYAIRQGLGHEGLPEFVADMPRDLHRSERAT